MNIPASYPPKHIKAVIFDHDGTLVDSEQIHCACWNQTLNAYGHSLDFKNYCERYNGLPTQETASLLKTRFSLSASSAVLYQQKIAHLTQYLSEQPFPMLLGVMDTLHFLHTKNIPMAIASGANRHEVMDSVRKHSMGAFFNVACTKNDVTQSKPAPDVYLLAAHKLNIEPQYCIAIEDSETGYAAATAAGIYCLRLTDSPTLVNEFKNMDAIHATLKEWSNNGRLG